MKNGFPLQSKEKEPQTKQIIDVLLEGSSLNCSGHSAENRTCHFRNLCYAHSDDLFVYVYGPKSREQVRDTTGGIDKWILFLTPVVDLDHHFRCINVTQEDLHPLVNDVNFIYRPGKHIIYTRFAIGNIFHLFHDELLPIFYTLVRYFKTGNHISSVKFFIFDIGDEGGFLFLYKLFSPESPMFKSESFLEPDGTVTCFEEATIGLVRETIWYQYGFKRTGGGPIDNLPLTSEHIRNFTTYVKEKQGIYPRCYGETFGIIFSRKGNRRLLNEKELRTSVSDMFHIEMIELSLEFHSLSYIIEKVSCAKLVVGMHGALLTMTMFLPPSSVLLEIFPYAMGPDHLSHYKTMIQLPGMDINYTYWRNMDKSKTVTHPTAGLERGGIWHLSSQEQQSIMNRTLVPYGTGGGDPEWLFRLYQDTIVDIHAICDILARIGFEKRRK
ncbi:Protein O-linked-mannose beta-1,4-N-acetylglucosaminyltransferase 2 [Holothuria leucospilota]|uniref:Protein O-linked-mannose beta-1,4-N-acetylglucosaminyltransferase 2 n=1 Tax=Holothuria leucospilota TaxID=206669 RepID=A0A9Q1C339_HOLLE|nr:Protein O-linked-mannose beta-1,4-N-acetylglucosaminyltransferase 2 [Holothuria leucospilota]